MKMDQYDTAKKRTDQTLQALEAHILTIRQRSQKLIERRTDISNRQRYLTQQNGGSNISGSDKIHLNVGGTEMYVLREVLTRIKGSRLEALFSGRWEDKLLRDEKGRVFIDMDVRYFKKIVEHLHLMRTSKDDDDKEEVPLDNWPKLPNETEQWRLELYLDLFRLRKEKNSTHTSSISNASEASNNKKKKHKQGTVSYEEMLDVIKIEESELDVVEKKLDEMEKDQKEEEDFVSFFTMSHPQVVSEVQGSERGSADCDTDDVISFTSMTSDDLASNISSIYHGITTDNAAHSSPIVHLWIDGEIIAVKRSTLCVHKGSQFADNFSNADWVKKNTLRTEDGTAVILMGYSSVMLSIVNQLRLQSMMVDDDDLPNIFKENNKAESVENMVSKLFPGLEERFRGRYTKLDSQIIESDSEKDQVMRWLEEVNRRPSEPKLLYRGSQNGWSVSSFHSKCDNKQHTLVVVKTVEGYVFGGYTDQTWNDNDFDGQSKRSSSSFLFSLKCYAGLSPTKMKIKSGYEGCAIKTYYDRGPKFGSGRDFCIGCSGYDLRKGYTKLNCTYNIPSRASGTFLTGKSGKNQKFDVAEVEVFAV